MSIDDIRSKVDRFDQAAARENLKSPQIIQKTKAVRFPQIINDISIFEVQLAAAADGIYNCYRQTTFGNFGPPIIEVLNLIENNTFTDYTPALIPGDRLAAWQMPNNEGTMHWVGFPLVPSVRMARTTEAAGDSQQITCNLIDNDGNEITSGLGSNIEVYGKVCGNENFDNASPLFSNDEYLFAININGIWWITGVFMSSEPHECA